MKFKTKNHRTHKEKKWFPCILTLKQEDELDPPVIQALFHVAHKVKNRSSSYLMISSRREVALLHFCWAGVQIADLNTCYS